MQYVPPSTPLLKPKEAAFLQIFFLAKTLFLYVSRPNELFKEMKKEANSLTASVWKDGRRAQGHPMPAKA